MDSFIFSINATVPVFAMMIFGNIFKRIGLIDDHFASVANRFVFKICLPCLVFLDLADTDIRHHFDVKYVGFCFAATLISILTVWILAKIFLKDKSSVGAFVQGAYRSSAAILGVAFIQNIYGTSGMAPLMIIGSVPLYNIFAVIVLTFESGGDSTDSAANIRKACINILKNPIIIGIVLGLAASYINLPLPGMIRKSINNLALMTSPLALISIGAGFEGRKAVAKLKPTFAASFMKLLGWAGIFLPAAVFFGFRDQELIALLIMLASPCTPAAYIMAKNMDGDDVLASSIVVVTTLFSSVTLTFWIFLLRSLNLIG
jgi:predicted permease